MEFKLEEYHRNTPEEQLLNDVKKVAEKLKKDKITMSEYAQYGSYHTTTLTRKFGSWFEVLKRSGLKPERKNFYITDEELFANIENIWIKLGRQPKYIEVHKPLSKFSAGTYDNRFGGWINALKIFIEYINSDINETLIESENNLTIDFENVKQFKHKTPRHISDRMRFRILLRDGFTCRSCGASPLKDRNIELHVDHILPWSKGGETIEENLETKCKQCNLGKGNAFNK